MNVEEVLQYFQGVKATATGWEGLCPAHNDKNPSLSIKEGDDGRVLLHCHAGCPIDNVVGAVGLNLADLFPDGRKPHKQEIVAAYDYTDAGGSLLYQSVRLEGKQFRQRRPDGNGGWTWSMAGVKRVLYRLPELVALTPGERLVFVVEGEKSCDRVRSEGLVATTSVAGTNSWRKGAAKYTEVLRDHLVAVVPDQDEAGYEYAREVANSLIGVAREVRLVKLPNLAAKGDISDWLDAGGTVEELKALVRDAPIITEEIPEWRAHALDYVVLPKDTILHPKLGEGAGKWVDVYSDYAETRCPMTPRLLHESAALWLASVAIARRLKVAMAFGDVFPNLFIAWIAPTTLYRKSTALGLAREVARQTFSHLLAPQDSTPEALLADLAGREPRFLEDLPELDRLEWQQGRAFAGQRGWMLDELSGLLAVAGKDYSAGLLESIVRFFDCDPQYTRHTRGQGRLIIRNSYLSLIGASTPAAMSMHLASDRLWSMGWWPRFAVLTPENNRPPWREPQEVPEPRELAGRLRMLYQMMPEPSWPDAPEAQCIELGEGVFEAWQRYNRTMSYDLLTDDLDQKLYGTYGRLATAVLKVATILAALDWSENQIVPHIEVAHLARAMAILEQWRASAHRAVAAMAATEFDKVRVRILKQITLAGARGLTFRDLTRAMRDKTPNELRDALQQMEDVGDIKPRKVRTKGKPKTVYHTVTE